MIPSKIIFNVWNRHRVLPFAWGTADCLTFCADCAKALTGADPIENLRGKYDTELGAQLAGARLGYKEIADVPEKFYERIHISDALTGDWALVENADKTMTLGVVNGAYILSHTQDGMGMVDRTNAVLAWQVVPR